MDTQYGREALANRSLYDTIVEHRRTYYALKYVNYDLHAPATIDYMIPERAMEAWRADYAEMRRFFIYGVSGIRCADGEDKRIAGQSKKRYIALQ